MATRLKKVRDKNQLPGQSSRELVRTGVQTFIVNDLLNQMLIEYLAPSLWKAKPPGKVRSIAAIFTHIHNVRCKWIRLTDPHLKTPKQLGRARCTPVQVRAALAESAARCAEMLSDALECGGPITEFRRDGWARPWPVGLEMVCYMVSHEAHHRGQVCMLAHQLGFKLPGKVTSELWNWEKLWRDCEMQGGPGASSS